MGSKTSKEDNTFYLSAPCSGTSESTRLTCSTSSAANDKIVLGARYFVRLSSLSGGPAFCKFAASVLLPASNAAVATGFWVDVGETVTVKASGTSLAVILTAGTGELLITRQDA